MNTPATRAWQSGWHPGGHGGLTGAVHSTAERTFRQADVPSVRRLAAEFGARSGIGPARLADFVLAVSEAAACVVAGGPGAARLRLWTTGRRVLCEVRGDGDPRHGAGGPLHGEAEAMRRRLLRQLCDCVSASTGPDGVTVLVSITVI
jgi:hypothetical protein